MKKEKSSIYIVKRYGWDRSIHNVLVCHSRAHAKRVCEDFVNFLNALRISIPKDDLSVREQFLQNVSWPMGIELREYFDRGDVWDNALLDVGDFFYEKIKYIS